MPFVEFCLNGRKHSATLKSPFYLMYGHELSYGLDTINSIAPNSDERLTQLKKDRDDVVSALTMAAERMKYYHDQKA